MIYIGQHQTDNINDDYMGSGLRIQRAIEKYGIENFEKTILFECNSEEEMNQKEAEIVNEDFIARDDVYNITLGGRGGWEHIHSCGARKGGLSATKRNKELGVTPFTIFYYSLTDKERLEYKKAHPVPKNFRFDWTGKHHSEETKQKMKQHRILYHPGAGEKNSQYGKMWIHNPELQQSKRINKYDIIPNGWIKGKVQDWNKYNQKQKEKQDKQLEKERKRLEIIELYKQYYQEYQKSGFQGVVEKFGYKYSRINFLNMCKKYVLLVL